MFRTNCLEVGERTELLRKAVSEIMLAVLLIGVLSWAFNIQLVKAGGTIYIRADGSIDPPISQIFTTDNITYMFTDDIVDYSIVVERSNIIIDGYGYSLTTHLDITYGFVLSNVAKVTIKNATIEGFWRGIRLSGSLNNIITQNNITNNSETGIELYESRNNGFYTNKIHNNGKFGINFMSSSGNILRNNSFAGNEYNISVDGSIQDIDESNSVNGKPIYYLVSRANMEIPSNAGYVGLINCYNITVKEAELMHNSQGILLVNTTNSKISNNVISNNAQGIQVWKSANNVFLKNNISYNDYGINFYESSGNGLYENLIANNQKYGIQIYTSSNNEVSKNNITNNREHGIYITMSSYYNTIHKNYIANNGISRDAHHSGIQIGFSSYNNILRNDIKNNIVGIYVYGRGNILYGNNITSNYFGTDLFEAYYNKIFHNNLINNTQHFYVDNSWKEPNYLDNGYPAGGNYWDGYKYTDSFSGSNQDQPGSDGIGDVPIIKDPYNIDNFPLIAPITIFDAGTWNQKAYNIDIISNSTVSYFYFNPDEGAFLRFNVSGENGTVGFCRVTIPKDLLWVEDGWTITVGNQQIKDYKMIQDEEYTYLHFTYNHSTQTVIIQGTSVIPEFSSSITLLLFMTVCGIAVILAKKRLKVKNKENLQN